jgi:hypothetical protein
MFPNISNLSLYRDEVVDYHQRGIKHSSTCQILEKTFEYNETVHQLFMDFKKAYDSVRREVLYNILIEFRLSMKLVRLIKMCLNEMYSKFHIGKHLSDNFPIQNNPKQRDTLLQLLFTFALEYDSKKV